jgi:hypothetical protein
MEKFTGFRPDMHFFGCRDALTGIMVFSGAAGAAKESLQKFQAE